MKYLHSSLAALLAGALLSACGGSSSSDPAPQDSSFETGQVLDYAYSFGFNGNANPNLSGVQPTVTGTVTYDTDRKGRANSAIVFNGSARLSIPHVNAMNLGTSATISMWVRSDVAFARNQYYCLLSKGSHQDRTESYALYFLGSPSDGTSSYTSTLFISRRNRTQTCDGTTTTVPNRLENLNIADSVNTTSRWYHVAVVYNGSGSGGTRVYVDGRLMRMAVGGAIAVTPRCLAPTFSNEIEDNTSPLVLGNPDSGLHPFTGRLDDLRVYNRALTDAEVEQLSSDR